MYIEVSRRPEGVLIHAEGAMDRYAAGRLHEGLSELAESGLVVVLDLAAVEAMDDSALGMLFGTLRRQHVWKRDCRVVLAPRAARIFEACGFCKVFPLYGSVTAAFAGDT